MNHPSELTSEEALCYLIECALMSGTNAAKAGAIERLRSDLKILEDVRTLDEWRAEIAPGGRRSWVCTDDGVGNVVELVIGYAGGADRVFTGPTTDAARAKAAAWRRGQ